VRELREFRAHYEELKAAGLEVAGVSLDSPESHRAWSERLRLPFPLLSDVERTVGPAFGVVRHVGLGGWNVEFFRRSTFLVDARGKVAAVWGKVKVRGHALEVLEMAKALPVPGR
jgi:peroxiredoxin Q/BCP